jgi:hypothetical protein
MTMDLHAETPSSSGRHTLRWFQAAALACGLLVAVLCPRIALAEIPVQVELSTGSDDLRDGNQAFFSAIFTDGTTTPEQLLSRGLSGSSRVTSTVNLPDTAVRRRIRGFVIRHDGSPRSGWPFDTYDNWDLKRVVVTHSGSVLYNSRDDSEAVDFVHRFTGQSRSITTIVRAAAGEPDFMIANMLRVPRGVQVTVRNTGANGRTSQVTCWVTGRLTTRSASLFVAGGGGRVSVTVGLALPRGTTTCAVEGTDLAGRPERMTANNVMRRVF